MSDQFAELRDKVCQFEGSSNMLGALSDDELNNQISDALVQDFVDISMPDQTGSDRLRHLKHGTSVYDRSEPEGVIAHARFGEDNLLVSLNATFNCDEKQVQFHFPAVGQQHPIEIRERKL